jgi:hypothetical protein
VLAEDLSRLRVSRVQNCIATDQEPLRPSRLALIARSPFTEGFCLRQYPEVAWCLEPGEDFIADPLRPYPICCRRSQRSLTNATQ